MKFEIIVYLLGILMGVTITYFGVGHYLENSEIKDEGIEVKVVKLKTKHTNKVYIPQAKYKGKIYDWYGGKGTEGRTYTAIYSPSKDKLLDSRSNWSHFFPIGLGVFFIGCGIYGVSKEVFFSGKKNRA